MAKNRSSVLIAIGVAVFVVGAGLAFLAVRSDGGDNQPRVQAAAQSAEPKPGEVSAAPTAAGAAAPTFSIPAGKVAVAVSVTSVQGVAGFAKAKDSVNVIGTVKPSTQVVPRGFPNSGVAKLFLSDIEVLHVGELGADGSRVFVLAVTPAEGEQLAYFQSFEGLYFELARSDQGAVSTPGRSAAAPL